MAASVSAGGWFTSDLPKPLPVLEGDDRLMSVEPNIAEFTQARHSGTRGSTRRLLLAPSTGQQTPGARELGGCLFESTRAKEGPDRARSTTAPRRRASWTRAARPPRQGPGFVRGARFDGRREAMVSQREAVSWR